MNEDIIFLDHDRVNQIKEFTKSFDQIKKYDKVTCQSNYIGYCGEEAFKDWLEMRDIVFVHTTDFKKAEYGSFPPDFEINGKSIDVKTSTGSDLIISSLRHDFYVHVSKGYNHECYFIKGFITKEILFDLLSMNKIAYKKTDKGGFYIVPSAFLYPMNKFEVALNDKD